MSCLVPQPRGPPPCLLAGTVGGLLAELSCCLSHPRIWPQGSALHVSLKESPRSPFAGWVPCGGLAWAVTTLLSLPCRRTTTSSSPSMRRPRTPSTSCAWGPRYGWLGGGGVGPVRWGMTLSHSLPPASRDLPPGHSGAQPFLVLPQGHLVCDLDQRSPGPGSFIS